MFRGVRSGLADRVDQKSSRANRQGCGMSKPRSSCPRIRTIRPLPDPLFEHASDPLFGLSKKVYFGVVDLKKRVDAFYGAHLVF